MMVSLGQRSGFLLAVWLLASQLCLAASKSHDPSEPSKGYVYNPPQGVPTLPALPALPAPVQAVQTVQAVPAAPVQTVQVRYLQPSAAQGVVAAYPDQAYTYGFSIQHPGGEGASQVQLSRGAAARALGSLPALPALSAVPAAPVLPALPAARYAGYTGYTPALAYSQPKAGSLSYLATYPATSLPAATYPATTYSAPTYPAPTYPAATYPATMYSAATYPAAYASSPYYGYYSS